jgi:hypothetical protein
MLTIRLMRRGRCDDCRADVNGVEFLLAGRPGTTGFLCWEHFRATLEAMAVAAARAVVPAGSDVAGTESRRYHAEQSLRHGDTKGGTDHRDAGGEG